CEQHAECDRSSSKSASKCDQWWLCGACSKPAYAGGSRFAAVNAVVTRAVAATRFVRDHLALFDEFKRLQGGLRDAGMRARGLVLPAPTRWYSIHACMRNVQNSQETLEILFLNPSYEGFLNRYRGTSPNRKKTTHRYRVGSQ
ncbi:hypothetical protein F442_03378, partial [Phytophthora nicotianae P10297]